MLNFEIDQEKCTRCGLCAKDCPPKIIEMESAANLKRTWVNNRHTRDWTDPSGARDFLDAATEVKTIWIPYGD